MNKFLIGLTFFLLSNSVKAQDVDTMLQCKSCVVKYPIIFFPLEVCCIRSLVDKPIFIEKAGNNYYKKSDLEFVIFYDATNHSGHIKGTENSHGQFSSDFVLSELLPGNQNETATQSQTILPVDLSIDSISNLVEYSFLYLGPGMDNEGDYMRMNRKVDGDFYRMLPDKGQFYYTRNNETHQKLRCESHWEKGIQNGPFMYVSDGFNSIGEYACGRAVGKWVGESNHEWNTRVYEIHYYDPIGKLICYEVINLSTNLPIVERNYLLTNEKLKGVSNDDFFNISYYENGNIKSEGWFRIVKTEVCCDEYDKTQTDVKYTPFGQHLVWDSEGVCSSITYE